MSTARRLLDGRGTRRVAVGLVVVLLAVTALLVLRDTPAMGMLLALHLGVVFGLFFTMPYGKFVHGIYRYLALVRYAKESSPENA